MRADHLRPDPHRQRATVRHLLAAAPLPRARGLLADPRHQHHRRQRQDLRGRERGRHPLGRPRGADDRRLRRRHRRPRPRPARPRASGNRDDRTDREPDRGSGRFRPCIRVGRRRLFPRPQLPRLRPALQPRSRRHGPGRGGGSRRAQGGAARLRPLEGSQARRGHRLAESLGRGPARLAHRVLGDGGGAARARLRDPRGRLRSGLPSPRERARADRGRPGRAARQDLDAQRDGPGAAFRRRRGGRRGGGGGQDGEVGRQRLPARGGGQTSTGRPP